MRAEFLFSSVRGLLGFLGENGDGGLEVVPGDVQGGEEADFGLGLDGKVDCSLADRSPINCNLGNR